MNGGAKQSVVVKNTLYEVMNGCFPVQNGGAATRILALLSFHDFGLEEGVSTLKNLNQNGLYTRIYAEEGYFKMDNISSLIALSDSDDWNLIEDFKVEMVDCYDQIFIPITSFSLVAELIHFVGVRALANIVQYALLKGKKVVMVDDFANPYSYLIGELNLDKGTNGMKQELYTQLKKLQSYGVTLIHANQVKEYLHKESTGRKKVLTEEHVLSARRSQLKEIILTSGTLITPLAKDIAKDLGIKLTFQ